MFKTKVLSVITFQLHEIAIEQYIIFNLNYVFLCEENESLSNYLWFQKW